jgi:hypothetical protein
MELCHTGRGVHAKNERKVNVPSVVQLSYCIRIEGFLCRKLAYSECLCLASEVLVSQGLFLAGVIEGSLALLL